VRESAPPATQPPDLGADTDTTEAKPRDSWRLLLAVVAAFGVAYEGVNALPLLLGSLVDGLGLDEAGAGALGSLELGGLAASSLLLAPRVDRMSRRRLAFCGALGACAGHGLSALADSFSILALARFAAGLGEGATIAAANSAAASARDPDRLFAKASVLGGLIAAATLVALPYAIEPWSYPGGFGAVAGITVLCVPFLLWLPTIPESAAAARGLPGRRLLGVVTLAATLLFSAAQGAIWAFSERIGIAIGFSREEVGLALGVTTLAGLAGGVIAAVLGTRGGRPLLLTLGLGANVVSTWMVVMAGSSELYLTGLLAWGIAFYFALPYLLGTAAALDPLGRWAAAAAGASAVGMALGPGAAGLVVSESGYPALAGFVIACGVGAAMLILPAARAADRH
jgi:predicted MFS family arabinose efflux permease